MERREDPGPHWVEGKTLDSVALALELGQHLIHGGVGPAVRMQFELRYPW